MQPATRKLIQAFLVVLFVLAAIRLALIWNERRQAAAPPPPRVEGLLSADDYVVPKKTYAYDLASLRRAVIGRPIWVRMGYAFAYFPYDAGRADFRHPAGTLGPLQQLDVTAVTTGVASEAPGQRQVLAVFRQDGRDYAFSVGAEKAGDMRLYIDDMVYIEDPRQLYGHWSADVWDAVSRHQVKPGMNQLQASFAVGVGHAGPGGMDNRTVRYPNGGHPLEVTYEEGRAVTVKALSE